MMLTGACIRSGGCERRGKALCPRHGNPADRLLAHVHDAKDPRLSPPLRAGSSKHDPRRGHIVTGLPRVPRLSRPRSPWAIFVLGGMERLTRSLMEGDEFDEEALNDMHSLAMRASAFMNALEARKRVSGVVVEPEDETATER